MALNAFEADGKEFVLFKSQTQGFARQRLLNNKFIFCVGNGCWSNHFIFDSVGEVFFFNFKGQPAQHVLQTRLGKDVGNAVAHT